MEHSLTLVVEEQEEVEVPRPHLGGQEGEQQGGGAPWEEQPRGQVCQGRGVRQAGGHDGSRAGGAMTWLTVAAWSRLGGAASCCWSGGGKGSCCWGWGGEELRPCSEGCLGPHRVKGRLSGRSSGLMMTTPCLPAV